MLRSVFASGAGTLASRVLGLLRDVIIASVFGAGSNIIGTPFPVPSCSTARDA